MARRGTDKIRFPGSVFFSDDGVKENHFQEVREQFNNGSVDPCRLATWSGLRRNFRARTTKKKQGKLTSPFSLGNVTKTCHTSMKRMANPSNYFTSSSKEYSERVGTPPKNSLVPLTIVGTLGVWEPAKQIVSVNRGIWRCTGTFKTMTAAETPTTYEKVVRAAVRREEQ